jgi:hypothetical protein
MPDQILIARTAGHAEVSLRPDEPQAQATKAQRPPTNLPPASTVLGMVLLVTYDLGPACGDGASASGDGTRIPLVQHAPMAH